MVCRRQVATLALAFALVLAGCSGSGGSPTTDATTTAPESTATTVDSGTTESETTAETTTEAATTTQTTTADAESVEVVGSGLSVDATTVFQRVQRLTGTDVRPQPVEVRNLTERKGYAPGAAPLYRYLGVGNLSLDPAEPGGLTTQSGKVYVHPGEGSPTEVERVLAHEFVHLVQYRANMFPWLSSIDQPRLSTDLLQTRMALIEGGAVYVNDAYADEHLDGADPAGRIADQYANASPGGKYFFARYHFGYQYVNGQLDSPDRLASVYQDHPNTTEQILHGYAPSEEPPVPLAASANASDDWAASGNDTMGELFTRVALQSELDGETAREAATGWGNDALHAFTSPGEKPGFAWTVRLDDASEADEFASAAETFAERRREASDASFRVVRVSDETVALVFGNPAFVDAASVSGSDGNVTVSVGA